MQKQSERQLKEVKVLKRVGKELASKVREYWCRQYDFEPKAEKRAEINEYRGKIREIDGMGAKDYFEFAKRNNPYREK